MKFFYGCALIYLFSRKREKVFGDIKESQRHNKKVKTTEQATFTQAHRRLSSAHNQYSSVVKY